MILKFQVYRKKLSENFFQVTFNKNYATKGQEEKARENFYINLKFIVENNFINGFELDINENADRVCYIEISKLKTTDYVQSNEDFGLIDEKLSSQFSYETVMINETLANYPATLDWTKKIKLTPPGNQGQCGSAWAFAAATAVEATYAIHRNTSVELSKQQLVDCDSFKYGHMNFGCGGGFASEAFIYIRDTGLVEAEHYKYTGHVSCSSLEPEFNCFAVRLLL